MSIQNWRRRNVSIEIEIEKKKKLEREIERERDKEMNGIKGRNEREARGGDFLKEWELIGYWT